MAFSYGMSRSSLAPGMQTLLQTDLLTSKMLQLQLQLDRDGDS